MNDKMLVSEEAIIMAIKGSLELEKFLEDYIKNREISNGPDSFEIYKRERGKDYDRAYTRAINEAYSKGRVSNYGAKAEAILDRGINGGYLSHLEAKRGEEYRDSVRELTDKRDEEMASAKRGYLAYLDTYGRRQDRIRNSLVVRLIENEVYDPEDIYRHAINAGLNPKEATATIGFVQSGTRSAIKKQLLDMIFNLTITPEDAAARAAEYGLPKEDIDYILEETEKYREYYEKYASGVIKDLEDEGFKSTGSYALGT